MHCDWPFEQPKSFLVLTSACVLDGKLITSVYHEEGELGWQFYPVEGPAKEEAVTIELQEIVEVDQSVLDLSALPIGWMAIRSNNDRTWITKEIDAILIDWTRISSSKQFFTSVLRQCNSPKWHGKNLNALRDSWVTGEINPTGPPYTFTFRDSQRMSPDMAEFRDAVLEIARESVRENGGRIRNAEQVVPPKSDRAGG